MWTYTVGDVVGVSASKIDQVMAVVEAAAEYWGRYIAFSGATLDVRVNFITLDDSLTLAQAGTTFHSNGSGVYQADTIRELQTGVDQNGSDADIEIDVNATNLNSNTFYYGLLNAPPSSSSGLYDLFTVMLHEIGHGLGILSFIGDGSGDVAVYDQNVSTIGGKYYFTGAAASAAYGDIVPLAGEPSHISRNVLDLLNAELSAGTRLFVSAIDTGILADTGLPILQASNGDDTLYGYEAVSGSITFLGGDDSASLLDGDDWYSALSGDDTVDGGAGADTIFGGNGDDSLVGGIGGDSILGGSGNDYISGASDADNLQGESGADTVSGGAGDDIMRGNDGNDRLYGDDGKDTVLGGYGNDLIEGREGDDFLKGDPGNDWLLGGEGNDSIQGGDDQDVLRGENGNDVLFGDNGQDTVEGAAGSDELRGGAGNDTLSGGDDGDLLFGWGEDDLLLGDAGNDFMKGDEGNDTLDGGAGVDSLQGNAGLDVYRFSPDGAIDYVGGFAGGAGASDQIELIGYGAAFDTYAEVMAAATQSGTRVIIDFGGGDQIHLLSTQLSSLNADDFLFG
ncbi:MAG: hypothetical protein H6848_00560 [Caulobacterales bacterium]|nr:hypothetical protein [Caulobacterales bacterium]